MGLRAMILFVKIYVDDMNQGGRMLPYGTYYQSGKMFRRGIGWSGKSFPGTVIQKKTIETESEI